MHDVTPRVGQRRWQAAVLALVITALIVLTNWLLSSTPALAHTDLVATRPGDGDVLIDPVSRIELEFSGAVDADGISIRLLDGNGRDILATTTQISEELVAVEPQQELDGGRYAVLWSVRSASDGHEISGSFSFEVSVASSGTGTEPLPDTEPPPTEADASDDAPVEDGEASETAVAAPPPTPSPIAVTPVATPIESASTAVSINESGNASGFLEWLGRWIAMIGAIVGVGAIGFAATSLIGTAGEVRRAASWIRLGGILILIGSVVELAALATSQGYSLAEALMPWTWVEVLPTAQAYAMVLRVAGGIAMLQSPRLVLTSPGPPVSDPLRADDGPPLDEYRGPAVATAARADTTRHRLEIQHEWLTIAGAGMVIVSFGLDGHTADAGLIGRLASMTHVFAAGIWAGGLVVMADLLVRRRRSSRPTEAAAVAVRFSRVASAALVLTAVAGGVLAWSLVDEPSELWSGAWGRTLGVKLALVAVAAAIGAYNHYRVVPHLDDADLEASGILRRTVTIESLVLIAVLAVTAVLVTAAP